MWFEGWFVSSIALDSYPRTLALKRRKGVVESTEMMVFLYLGVRRFVRGVNSMFFCFAFLDLFGLLASPDL